MSYLYDLKELHNVLVRDLLQDGHLGLQALSEFSVQFVCRNLLDSHDTPGSSMASLPHNGKGASTDVLRKHPFPDRPCTCSVGPHCRAFNCTGAPTRA